jgi:uncharacterized protein (DUF362 family)
MKKNLVYIKQMNKHKYPLKVPYNPSNNFAEYPFGDKELDGANIVYEELRNLLSEMNLDKDNFDTKKWNPFKELIKPGDMVVLKPNMVMHKNGLKQFSTDCLITHGSIIRAILDYVYIALKGKGKIIIADAPLQKCDFSKVTVENGTRSIVDFYKKNGIKIELIDFREERAITDSSGRIKGIEKLKGDPRGYTAVDLGKDSILYDIIDGYKKFRVTGYNPDLMKEHHNPEKNEYLIANTILEADVIINLPKPKTHKRAGITGAMKNLVGICGNKDWLPHHTRGSKFDGGDEYLNHNLFKEINVSLQEKIDVAVIKNKKLKRYIIRNIQKINSIFRKITTKDKCVEGSWWGNDTIWRMICDLNRLLIYADKNGIMRQTPQRKYIAFLDMIISGEGEGPLNPNPKYSGILMAGFNPLVIDTVMATIMGFDFRKIPNIYKAYIIKKYSISNYNYEDIKIISNNKAWSKKITDINFEDTLKYKPSLGWKSHIEMG